MSPAGWTRFHGATSVLLVFAGLALGVSALTRRSPRPLFLEDGWLACLVERAALAPARDGGLRVSSGVGAVLRVSARWHESHLETEHISGELLVELPGELRAGSTLRFSGGAPLGSYRERGQGIVFHSQMLEGTIQVRQALPGAVVLSIDLQAKSPSTDDLPNGPPPLVGTVRAVRATDLRACSRR
jgi:hypothetical protein